MSILHNLFNSINENIIIYNGEFLSEDIKDSVTKSIENLFNNCKSIYDQKIYRSNHCIWFVLSKNIPEYLTIIILKNIYAKATNKDILKNALTNYPTILQNYAIPYSYLYFNLIHDLPTCLINTEDNNSETFDLLG
jgi:hypothetical protein